MPRVGESIWFSDDERETHGIAYKVENVMYAYHGGEVQFFVKREPTLFFKQWGD
ncbi:MAG: hypothetical protein JOY54_06210 [Acidobacteriaceae bacterium]|nr:hypothetical protein [Acidobacteriaceae bacterium]